MTAKYEGQLDEGSGLPNGTGSLHVYSSLTRRDITIAEKNIPGGYGKTAFDMVTQVSDLAWVGYFVLQHPD